VDIDTELRRLFRDPRLEVPVQPAATRVVLEGAIRLRRRRSLLRAGLAVALLCLCVLRVWMAV
jgi:hypothetical protein